VTNGAIAWFCWGSNGAPNHNRRLASFWFGFSVKPIGWSLPPVWDAIAGDYASADGWIRLHTTPSTCCSMI
jgi:hypothetical protein